MTPIFSVPNEQVLQEWEAELAKAKKSKSREYTLLPEQYKSVPVPCGLAQNLKVTRRQYRFGSHTSRLISSSKSTTELS